jgi:hypothetical protein
MLKGEIYHSALRPDLPLTEELSYYESNGSVVFQHDISKGIISPHYKNVDCIYSEPAWRAGYEVFKKRSGSIVSSTFEDYLGAIKKFVETLNKPTFLVIGKHMLKALAPNEGYYEIKLHKWNALLGLWNIVGEEFDALNKIMCGGQIQNNKDVMNYVIGRYNIIGDFSCGYGNLVSYAVMNNKKFVCSDLNAKCVCYVAKNYMGYV